MIARGAIGLILLAAVGLAGCNTVRTLVGAPSPGDPSELKSAEARWLLVRNPRFGDVPSEPEYVWVEEDKIPTTLATLLRGKGAIIAPPEVVAKYGSPPGGGKISPRQRMPYQAVEPARAAPGAPAAARAPGGRNGTPAAAVAAPKRGYVVFVDTTRVVIDLTAADGVRPGNLVSVRRDRIPIVHPITGEVLGELDEEVATARVTEMRERFSVAEIQAVVPGTRIQVKDRVVPK